MAQAYTPGLQVSANTTLRRVRELPLSGKNEVEVGELVTAQDTVLSASLPGEVEIIRVADRMGLEPLDVQSKILVENGEKVKTGTLLCRVETFFGWFKTELISPLDGEIEFFTEANAHLGIRTPSTPLKINAYISGEVVDVKPGLAITIETSGTFIQGIFGVGGERQGRIKTLNSPLDQEITKAKLQQEGDLNGRIIIGGSYFSPEALAYAGQNGVEGIITGSIDAETLRDYVGFEIGVSITGDEEVPATLIVTEGFGQLPMSNRVFELAKKCEDRAASLNGATQVRAGAMRPELIIPGTIDVPDNFASDSSKQLALKARVRVIRVPYFGALATVEELPPKPEAIESGAVVRVLRARLDNTDELVTVPRANVELI